MNGRRNIFDGSQIFLHSTVRKSRSAQGEPIYIYIYIKYKFRFPLQNQREQLRCQITT